MAPRYFLDNTCVEYLASAYSSATNFTICAIETIPKPEEPATPQPRPIEDHSILGTTSDNRWKGLVIAALVISALLLLAIYTLIIRRHASASVVKRLRVLPSYEVNGTLEDMYADTQYTNKKPVLGINGRYPSITWDDDVEGQMRKITIIEDLNQTPKTKEEEGKPSMNRGRMRNPDIDPSRAESSRLGIWGLWGQRWR